MNVIRQLSNDVNSMNEHNPKNCGNESSAFEFFKAVSRSSLSRSMAKPLIKSIAISQLNVIFFFNQKSVISESGLCLFTHKFTSIDELNLAIIE